MKTKQKSPTKAQIKAAGKARKKMVKRVGEDEVKRLESIWDKYRTPEEVRAENVKRGLAKSADCAELGAGQLPAAMEIANEHVPPPMPLPPPPPRLPYPPLPLRSSHADPGATGHEEVQYAQSLSQMLAARFVK